MPFSCNSDFLDDSKDYCYRFNDKLLPFQAQGSHFFLKNVITPNQTRNNSSNQNKIKEHN
jgi:hypothetical protein